MRIGYYDYRKKDGELIAHTQIHTGGDMFKSEELFYVDFNEEDLEEIIHKLNNILEQYKRLSNK